MSKICTTVKQSKKLIELGIDINTADMFWDLLDGDEPDEKIPSCYPDRFDISSEEFVPAWSLSALLNVLPNNENISTTLSKGGYRISTLEYTNSWFVDYEDETNGLNNCVTSADSPVDACYDMVLRLHELNLL